MNTPLDSSRPKITRASVAGGGVREVGYGEAERWDQASPEAVLKRRVQVGIVFVILLTGARTFLTMRVTHRDKETTDWITHTIAVQKTLQSAYGHAANAGTDARGYVVTNNGKFSVAYLQERDALRQDMDTVGELTVDNASQQRRIETLRTELDAWVRLVDSIEDRKRSAGSGGTDLDFLAIKQGMDAVLGTLAEMQGEEAKLLSIRMLKAHEAIETSRVTVIVSSVFGISVLIIAGIILLREINRCTRMQGQVMAMELRAAESRRSEEEARKNSRYVRSLIEACLDPLLTINRDGKINDANGAAERITGKPRQELIGSNFSELFTDPESARIGYQYVFADGTVKDYPLAVRGVSGVVTEVLFNASVFENDEGEIEGIIAAARDITEMNKAAQEMRSLNALLERYRIMVESIEEYAIYTLDADGVILSWGRGAQKASGMAAEQVVGQHYSMFYSQTDLNAGVPQRELLEAARLGRYAVDRWRLLPSGVTVWSSGVLTAIRNDEGALTGFVRVARDMTHQKRLEESLERMTVELEDRVAERTRQLEATVMELRHKNEEVEAFVYIVSHDLRAPLVNLIGFARELEESCVRLKALLEASSLPEASSAAVFEILDEDMPSSVHFISQSSLKFERLIDALLNLSRHGRQIYRLVDIDVEELAANAVATFHKTIEETGAEVELGRMPRVVADMTALEQVISNLIGNSLKYRSTERPLRIEIGGQVEGEVVHYWVRDNGMGIPESSKSRLFQVFQRFHPRHAQGDGMGLAIVHRIVERHGGRIWADSREGEGTTFHFCLPRDSEAGGAEGAGNKAERNEDQGVYSHGIS